MSKFVPYDEVANTRWQVLQNDNGRFYDEAVNRAILLDIRAALSKLNNLLHCHNAVDIPNILRRIDANTKPKARRKRAAAKGR